VRILLIEDHPIVRAGCRQILLLRKGTEVVDAADAAHGLRLAAEFRPDVVVLDVKLPDTGGLELLALLLDKAPKLKIIVFSMYDDPAFAARALEAGAAGYITKNDDPEVLLQAVETVTTGGVFLTDVMARKIALRNDPLRILSQRERQVLELLGRGKTLSEIAEQLNVSYRSSASITAQIKAKLNIQTTAALIKWAADHSSSWAH
jgi:DNA-binding NarL/FixJ family response regulator